MKPGNHLPRVSIGLPVYNSERYLEQSLTSIVNQTYTDFELIISDNASTDQTEEICRAFATRDQRIRYSRNQANLGATANFSRVYGLAKGVYFRWAAYDDLMAPRTLERCVEVLDRNPGVVLCYTKTINIDQNGDLIRYYEDDFAFGSPDPHKRFRDLLERIYGYDCNAVFGLIRRNALEDTTLIANYHSSDKVLLAQLVLKGQFHEIPEYMFFKRFHKDMSTVACKTEREFANWHDPSNRRRTVFPTLRRAFEFVKTVQYGPLNWWQKAYCHGALAKFYLIAGRKWRKTIAKNRADEKRSLFSQGSTER